MDINGFDLAMAAVVLPPLIALINRRAWPAQLKGIVALAVCAAYTLLVLWLRGPVDWANWRDLLLVVAAGAFAAYRLWWQPSQIAPAIENATSPPPPPSTPAG